MVLFHKSRSEPMHGCHKDKFMNINNFLLDDLPSYLLIALWKGGLKRREHLDEGHEDDFCFMHPRASRAYYLIQR